jgi:hypothetical protein
MRTEQTMLIPTPADAHDSDASTLFEMIWNYIEFTWDWQWLAGASPIPNKTYLQVLQGVWDKNLATLYNNLTPTFQDNINPYTGESFTQQYTEDNCESYTGSIAASKIFNLLGDSTRSTNAATNAATVNAGLFLLINSEKGVIGWFYGDDFSWFQNPTLAWYPWYQAQFFPELHQIPAANSTLHADARQYVITFWNNWFSDPGLTAGLSNIMFGYLAARFWQDHEKANASVVMTETIFLANGLLSSDFGYYLKTKQILVNSNLLSTVNGAKVAFRDFVGNVTVLNRTRNATAAGTVQIFPQDYWVGVDSTGSAVTLNLPNRTLLTDSWSCIIKDIGGDAGTNNITITPDGGKIDGSGTKVISSNYGSVTIRYNKANNQFYTE